MVRFAVVCSYFTVGWGEPPLCKSGPHLGHAVRLVIDKQGHEISEPSSSALMNGYTSSSNSGNEGKVKV
jgi:hypothetical protein